MPIFFVPLGGLDFDVAVLGERLIELRDLVALRQVGIEVVLAGEDRALAHLAVQGSRGQHGKLDRLAFSTGKAPGMPRQTGHTFVFGAEPNCVEHPQNALVAVRS